MKKTAESPVTDEREPSSWPMFSTKFNKNVPLVAPSSKSTVIPGGKGVKLQQEKASQQPFAIG
jgi:hypothetical protein